MNPTPEQIETLTKTIAVLQAAIDGKELIHPVVGAKQSVSWLAEYVSPVAHLTIAPREDEPYAWVRRFDQSVPVSYGPIEPAWPLGGWIPLYTRPQPAPSVAPREDELATWVHIDLSSAMKEGAVRNKLIELGWTPPVPTVAPRKIKRKGWINVYPHNQPSDSIHRTKQSADSGAGPNRIACVESPEYEFDAPEGVSE
jgi:hypothetical protein